MKRILVAMVFLVGGVSALAGGTTAFFSDTETSTGNNFTAGAIDLLIDNDSYYNGNRCVEVTAGIWQWQGDSLFPEPGTPCTTSFGASNLDGLVFFDFDDIKPDDEGEDTISIHVQNDAWACMDLTLTSNDDRSSNEPELGDGDAQDTPNAWDGELAQNLQFFWWADDGDNVYEEGEAPLTKTDGVQTLYDLATSTGSFSIVLADPTGNAWGGNTPIPANETVYIAKAWCMGTLTLNPLDQDDSGTDGPLAPGRVGTGFSCDGTQLNNVTQTDGVEVSMTFRAEQARNNPSFLCNPPVQQQTASLTINKALLVSTAGIEVADFALHIVGPGGDQIVSDEVPTINLPAGPYTVYEVIVGDVAGKTFNVSFSGACTDPNADDVGELTLNPGDNVTCNILNNEIGDGIGD